MFMHMHPLTLTLSQLSSSSLFTVQSNVCSLPSKWVWVSDKTLRYTDLQWPKGFRSSFPHINVVSIPRCAHRKLEKKKAKTIDEQNTCSPEIYCPARIFIGRDSHNAMPASSDDPQYSELASNIDDSGNSKTMWATLGQRFNSAGIISTLGVMIREQHLALPHLSVPDIRWINWKELKKQGFQGIVFDKDNTLTAPYAPSLWPTLAASLEDCKSVFEGRIALLSNSAGLYQYDADGSEAKALEDMIGIPVIRHGTKKPAGTAKDIEKYFGSDPSLLVMVGDRHFTDIVYGNRNGFLTILTEPLTLAGEPFIVRQVRKLEGALIQCWSRKGITPASHHLFLGKHECIKDPDW